MRAINFIERACVHTKSVWSGKPFILEPWQRGSAWQDAAGKWKVDGMIAPIFGAVKWSPHWNQWVRNYSEVWIELARKQGKSELLAAIGLYMLIMDGEQSAEVIGAASDKEQASAVFNVARDIVRLSPVLSKLEAKGDIEIIDSRKRIIYRPTRSVYRVVSADAMSNLGANPSAILFDEVLAQPGRELWDYLRQGFGTRPNQILIGITTAGPDRESFAYTEHLHSIQVAADPNLDPKRFAYVAYVDEEADWQDESLWPDANPGLNTIIDIDTLRGERDEALAKGDMAALANFKIFRLNQWGNDANRWLDMLVWDESEEVAGRFSDEDLGAVPAVGALDMADTVDFIGWSVVWPTAERTMVRSHFWITRKSMETRHKRIKHKIQEWADAGYVTIVEQNAHDHNAVREHIRRDLEQFNIQYVAYDQWQAPAVVNPLDSSTDTEFIKIPQTTQRMNPGALELTRLMGLRSMTSNENPVLRWHASNANYRQDTEGKIKPDKLKSKAPIEGVVTLVMALAVHVGLPEESDATMWAFDDDELYGGGED